MTTITAPLQKTKLSSEHQDFITQMMNPVKFRLFLLQKVPLGLIAGMKLKHLDAQKCQATIPYRWITTNPFKSAYFAALAMAAELSTGSLALLSVYKTKPSVAVIIVGMQAEFLKKATGLTTFTCTQGEKLFAAVERAAKSGEPVAETVETIGTAEDGTVVAKFKFTWSFKRRK